MTTKDEDKEIDRILRIVEKLASVEAKFDLFFKDYLHFKDSMEELIRILSTRITKIEVEGSKPLKEDVSIQDIETSKQREEMQELKNLFVEWKDKNDRLKWIMGGIACLLSPIITTFVILLIQRLFGL